MKIVVTGGRDFTQENLIHYTLDKLHQKFGFTRLIDGKARGVDTICNEWAVKNNIDTSRYPAKWDKFGKAAGHIRNKEMVDKNPDLVIAFPGGTGTKNMSDLAEQRNIPLIVISEHGNIIKDTHNLI